MKKIWIAAIAALTICVNGLAANAGTIDFESGFSDLDPLGPAVLTGENVVTFSVGSHGGGPGYIAEVGDPTTAFVPSDSPAGARAGDFFLTDEVDGPGVALDYFMDFKFPVSFLSLDLYDFRGDGGAPVGSTATLTLYDAADAVVGSDSFTIPSLLEEGNVVALSVSPSAEAMWASVTFDSGDVGTGIDNISIETVPEPATIALLGIGALGLLAGKIRRRR